MCSRDVWDDPGRRIPSIQDTIVPSAQRAANLADIEPQGTLRCDAYRRQARDEEIGTHECEVVGPGVVARIEKPDCMLAHTIDDMLAFTQIAEGAAPGEVIDMIGTAPTWYRRKSGA